MYYFYEIPASLRMVIQIILLLSVAIEIALILIYVFIRKDENYRQHLLFELGIAWHFAVLNLCLGLIQISEPKNLIVNPYPMLRDLSILAPILGMPLLLREHRNIDLMAIFSLTFSLPFFESFLGPWYVNQFIILSLFLFLRAVSELNRNYKYLQANFSRFSMKQAFDTFPEGLAIGRDHGKILIINRRMREIMTNKGLIPDIRSSGLRLSFRRLMKRERSEKLDRGEDTASISDIFRQSYKQGNIRERHHLRELFPFPSKAEALTKAPTKERFWSFRDEEKIYRYSEEPFFIQNKKYWQILLSDITKESDLILKIQDKNQELEESNKKLLAMIQNIEAIEMDKERRRMRNRIHDVMGQRLSILHSSLQNIDRKEEVPLPDLIKLLEDMLEDLNEPENLDSELRYQNIEKTAAIVGTELKKQGEIPKDPEVSAVFLQILREAVTNAIRHGKAARVLAEFSSDAENYYLDISNDGEVPKRHLVEGEGIKGMRHKLMPLAGRLEIEIQDKFKIKIRVPRFQREDSTK